MIFGCLIDHRSIDLVRQVVDLKLGRRFVVLQNHNPSSKFLQQVIVFFDRVDWSLRRFFRLLSLFAFGSSRAGRAFGLNHRSRLQMCPAFPFFSRSVSQALRMYGYRD